MIISILLNEYKHTFFHKIVDKYEYKYFYGECVVSKKLKLYIQVDKHILYSKLKKNYGVWTALHLIFLFCVSSLAITGNFNPMCLRFL